MNPTLFDEILTDSQDKVCCARPQIQKPARSFEEIIKNLSYKTSIWRVFSDFCEMSAISLANVFVKSPELEKRYLEIAANYETPDLSKMAELLGMVSLGLTDNFCDFLGEQFMKLELGNEWKGQFFTPYTVSLMMAKMNLDHVPALLEKKPYVTLCDPCCGAGSMVVAAAQALKDINVNYQEKLFIEAMDVDATAFHMCFIQMSLLHIPGIVRHGDSLNMNFSKSWATPAFYLGGWNSKLNNDEIAGRKTVEVRPEVDEALPNTPTMKEALPRFDQMSFDFGSQPKQPAA